MASSLKPSKEELAVALEQMDEQITPIVVIDDNTHDSRLIRRLLRNHKQYRVFEAHTDTNSKRQKSLGTFSQNKLSRILVMNDYITDARLLRRVLEMKQLGSRRGYTARVGNGAKNRPVH